MKGKLICVTRLIFGYGLSLLLLICFFVAIAYIVAFFMGLPTADAINSFCSIILLPVVYKAAILLCLIGLFNMYLRGQLIFRLELPKKQERK